MSVFFVYIFLNKLLFVNHLFFKHENFVRKISKKQLNQSIKKLPGATTILCECPLVLVYAEKKLAREKPANKKISKTLTIFLKTYI